MEENEEHDCYNGGGQLKKDMEHLIDRVDTIYQCLYGQKEDHSDIGMQGEVNKNTRFRKILVGAITTLGGALVLYTIASNVAWI